MQLISFRIECIAKQATCIPTPHSPPTNFLLPPSDSSLFYWDHQQLMTALQLSLKVLPFRKLHAAEKNFSNFNIRLLSAMKIKQYERITFRNFQRKDYTDMNKTEKGLMKE